MTAPEEWAWLARIRRPQGRKGEVFADILTDFPDRFSERPNLWLIADPESPRTKSNPAPAAAELTNHWPHKGGIVLHFAGVDSISAAELLAGKIVAIPQSERAPLPEDEVYIADLIGCALVDVAGPEPVLVGQIESVGPHCRPCSPPGSAGRQRRSPDPLRQELSPQPRSGRQTRGNDAPRRAG